MLYQRTFRVRYYECDMYGHVNHANYLRYMQEAALDASAMATAFLPAGLPEAAAPREPFPEPPPPPPGVFTGQRRVAWRDVDPARHVNNANYLAYMEDCAVQAAAAHGWTTERMVTEGGFAIIARRFRVEYKQPAVMDDELEVATWVSGVKRATAMRHYTITRFPREVVAASAPICGMTDLVVDYETTRPDLRPYSEEMLGGSPAEVPERYYQRSPIHFVDNVKGHLLIVQGLQDPNVTPENVRTVTQALQRAGVEYQLLAFDNEVTAFPGLKTRRRYICGC